MFNHARQARRSAGFSLTDLMIVTVVIVGVLAMQLPTDAASRRTAKRMQNSTQLRGIHQGLVTFANSNKNNFAGLNSRGETLPDNDRNTGSSGDGEFVQARYWIMLRGDFFTPEYAISPSETAKVTEYEPGLDNIAAPVQWNDRVKHYSYAMLDIREASPGRRAEWKQTLNSQSIVLTDRNAGHDAGERVASIHTDGEGEWRGSVLWNDNHVAFDNQHDYFATKYGAGALLQKEGADWGDGYDNLFSSENDGNDKAGNDALMLIADKDVVHDKE
ncbi:MAG: type II secretion system protein [Phycisphaeraceae bacterium]